MLKNIYSNDIHIGFRKYLHIIIPTNDMYFKNNYDYLLIRSFFLLQI